MWVHGRGPIHEAEEMGCQVHGLTLRQDRRKMLRTVCILEMRR